MAKHQRSTVVDDSLGPMSTHEANGSMASPWKINLFVGHPYFEKPHCDRTSSSTRPLARRRQPNHADKQDEVQHVKKPTRHLATRRLSQAKKVSRSAARRTEALQKKAEAQQRRNRWQRRYVPRDAGRGSRPQPQFPTHSCLLFRHADLQGLAANLPWKKTKRKTYIFRHDGCGRNESCCRDDPCRCHPCFIVIIHEVGVLNEII